MKVEELTIGNLVACKGQIAQVAELYADTVRISCGGYMEEVYYEELEGLAVSPETLEMMGFVEVGSVWFMNTGAQTEREIRPMSGVLYAYNNGLTWSLHAFKREYFVRAIHTLQNLLQVLHGITISPTLP